MIWWLLSGIILGAIVTAYFLLRGLSAPMSKK